MNITQIEKTSTRLWLAVLIAFSSALFIGSMVGNIVLSLQNFSSLQSLNNLSFIPWWWALSLQEIQAPRYELALWSSIFSSIAVFVLVFATSIRPGVSRHAKARFQSPREIKKNKLSGSPKPNWLIFGKLGKPKAKADYIISDPDVNPHGMIIAPTGAGKGLTLITNLLNWTGSAIVLDISDENFIRTSAWRANEFDQEVFYFNPFSNKGSNSFNPLLPIADIEDDKIRESRIYQLLDYFLVPDANNRSFFDNGKHWAVASILYAIEQGQPTLGKAVEYLNGEGDKENNYRVYAENSDIDFVQRQFLNAADENEKTRNNNISVVKGAGLGAWEQSVIIEATNYNDINFLEFRRKPSTLYIGVRENDLVTLAPLVRLLFASAIFSLVETLPDPSKDKHEVLMVLDEFDALKRQPLVLQSIKTIRKYLGRYLIISQSLVQLEGRELYSQSEVLGLQANCGIQMFMTPNETATAQSISKLLGNTTVVSKSVSSQQLVGFKGSANISRQGQERALMTEAELMSMDKTDVIVKPQGLYPIKAKALRYFEDHYFAQRYKYYEHDPLPYPQIARPNTAITSNNDRTSAKQSRSSTNAPVAVPALNDPFEGLDEVNDAIDRVNSADNNGKRVILDENTIIKGIGSKFSNNFSKGE